MNRNFIHASLQLVFQTVHFFCKAWLRIYWQVCQCTVPTQISKENFCMFYKGNEECQMSLKCNLLTKECFEPKWNLRMCNCALHLFWKNQTIAVHLVYWQSLLLFVVLMATKNWKENIVYKICLIAFLKIDKISQKYLKNYI